MRIRRRTIDGIYIAIDESGYIYAADPGNYRIQKFGPQGTFITQWGSEGDKAGQFGQLQGIGVDKLGKVYTIDGISTQRIQIFDSIGNYLGVLTLRVFNLDQFMLTLP